MEMFVRGYVPFCQNVGEGQLTLNFGLVENQADAWNDCAVQFSTIVGQVISVLLIPSHVKKARISAMKHPGLQGTCVDLDGLIDRRLLCTGYSC